MGNCFFGSMADPDPDEVIKVITSNGGIMEFCAPITVSFITNEFPGHAIFPSHDLFWKPLSQFDELVAGQSYYLLPLDNKNNNKIRDDGHVVVRQGHIRSHSVPTITSSPAPYRMSLDYHHHHVMGLLKRFSTTESFSGTTTMGGGSSQRFKSRSVSPDVVVPKRLQHFVVAGRIKPQWSASARNNRNATRTTNKLQPQFKTYGSGRFWKVKLVISPQQLLEILAQEARTKELIESVRIVAKCGIASGGGISSAAAAARIVSDQWSLSTTTSWSNSSKIDAFAVEI